MYKVLFANGWVLKENGDVLIYYGSADTRVHVAKSHIELLVDYMKNTPSDTLYSAAGVKQRIRLIKRNLPVIHKFEMTGKYHEAIA